MSEDEACSGEGPGTSPNGEGGHYRKIGEWGRNEEGADNRLPVAVAVDWQFTTADARIKLKHLYPSHGGRTSNSLLVNAMCRNSMALHAASVIDPATGIPATRTASYRIRRRS